MHRGRSCALIAAAALGTTAAIALAVPVPVTVTIENISPENGTYFTPVWVGFHNGQFDVFTPGTAASVALERIAEDGNTAPLASDFTASALGTTQGTIPGPGGTPPVFPPGTSASQSFVLESTDALNRYFSYASMVVPSNDAFISNPDPQSFQIFDGAGNFIPQTILVLGSQVWDAGTEVNDEEPANTAFFGQTTPNTGVTEGGVVQIHPGYKGSVANPGTAMILADPRFANADFKLPGYEVARITIVPEPGGALGGMLVGACALLRGASRRRRRAGARVEC
jgi:hypothetical protein